MFSPSPRSGHVPARDIYRELTLPPSGKTYNQQGNNLIFEAHNFDGPVLILMLSSVSGKYPCLKHPVAHSSGSYDGPYLDHHPHSMLAK